MRNVPFGAIKEHVCPSRTFPAQPAAHVPKEPLSGWKSAMQRGCIPLGTQAQGQTWHPLKSGRQHL